MQCNWSRRFYVVAAALALAVPAAAQQEDHPLISPYAGSELVRHASAEFDEYVIPLGPVEGVAVNARLTDSMVVEGTVTQLQYEVEGRSTLEIFRNYESALRQAGFEDLFATQGRGVLEAGNWVEGFYNRHSGQRWASASNPRMAGNDFRYLAARLERPTGDVYVSLYVTTGHTTLTQLDIIEAASMDTERVVVDVAYLEDSLERTGFVALYGIHFATDAAEMTEASRPALDAIAQVLEQNPAYRLYVVGHTDNVGRYDYNLDLSGRRAESVVRELAERYGLGAERLQAVGVGPVSPVATNRTDEGRARNRRVELVLR